MANKRPLIAKNGRQEEITSTDVLYSEKGNYPTSLVIPNTQTTPGTGGLQIKAADSELQADLGAGWVPVGSTAVKYFKTPVANYAALAAILTDTTGTIRQTLDTKTLYTWDGAAWEPTGLEGGTPIVDSTAAPDIDARIAYITGVVGSYTAGTGITFNCAGLGFTNILGLECSVVYSNFDDIIGVNKIYKVSGTNVIVKIVLQYEDDDEILLNELDPVGGTGPIELGTNITAINLIVTYN